MSQKPPGPVVINLDEEGSPPNPKKASPPKPEVSKPETDALSAKALEKASSLKTDGRSQEPKEKRRRPTKQAAPQPQIEPREALVDPSSAPMIIDDEPSPRGEAMVAATRLVSGRISWVAKLFWGAAVSLLVLYLTTGLWDFAADLVTRNVFLGRFAVALGLLLLFALVVIAIKEFLGFASLSRLDGFRRKAEALRSVPNEADAKVFVRNLSQVYRSRADMRWAVENLKKHEGAVLDASDMLDLAETELMAPLDKAARQEIESSARQVAAATAVVPLAMADVFIALTANIRMVRRIAEIYGGRAGTIGSWRLMRAVATHLIATGAVGVADDMIGSVAGGGFAAKLSRRFGEGIINGALTARVGLAAIDVCRPMPFEARQRPGVTSIVQTALTGMFSKS